MSDNRENEIDDFEDVGHHNQTALTGQANTAGTATTGNTPAVPSAVQSDDDYLEYAYQTALGRSSDQDGKTHWLQELRAGHVNRDSLLESFKNSQEGLEHAATISTTATQTVQSDDDYLEYVYQAALGRNSDQDGKAHWLQELRAGHVDRDSLLETFKNSQEGLEHASQPNGINASLESGEYLSLIGVSTVSHDMALLG